MTLYAGFYGFLFVSYLVSSFLYRFNRPSQNKSYIIVLGAGLLKGKEISPLLASRLDRACHFYEMQKKVAPPPKIIVTGGRGEDELISEAEAMRGYLLDQHIPAQQIILEDKATNTMENFQYSKSLFQDPAAPSVFVTNHYHLFRASLYARQSGIEGDGIGSPTTWYYLPNAYTREFLALIEMYKWVHVGLLIVFVIVSALLL
nr:YdcF family protein [Shouchella xiaoxiensis]